LAVYRKFTIKVSSVEDRNKLIKVPLPKSCFLLEGNRGRDGHKRAFIGREGVIKMENLEMRIIREWKEDPKLRQEFRGDISCFAAFMRAQEKGLVKVLHG